MRHRMSRLFLIALTWLLLAAGVFAADVLARDLPPTLRDFSHRVDVATAQLPLIIQAAEAAAARKVAHPDAVLAVPRSLQLSFSEELRNRSGGLAEAMATDGQPALATDHDIVLFSIRSWEVNGAPGLAYLQECRNKGWMVILFASSAGKPADLQVDYFIDNGANSGAETDAAVNTAANALNGWLWVCEYTAALSRLGKYPGILSSITNAGSIPFDQPMQAKSRPLNLYPGGIALPAGDLAHIYLTRVGQMVEDLSSPITRGQLDVAAGIIAGRLNAGKPVFVATSTHIMMHEMDLDNKTPWKALAAWRRTADVLARNTHPGDLLYFLGFNGVSVWYYPDEKSPTRLWSDYDAAIRAAKLDLITCCARDPLHPDNNGDYALARIEQHWGFGDSEVPIPFLPGRMAPISGLYQCLLYRMLDDITAAQLK